MTSWVSFYRRCKVIRWLASYSRKLFFFKNFLYIFWFPNYSCLHTFSYISTLTLVRRHLFKIWDGCLSLLFFSSLYGYNGLWSLNVSFEHGCLCCFFSSRKYIVFIHSERERERQQESSLASFSLNLRGKKIKRLQ